MRTARPGTQIGVRRLLALLIAVGLLAGCGGDDDSETGPEEPARTAPQPEERGGALDFDRVETVAGGLDVPWEVAFPDRDTILVTERPGRVRVIEEGELRGRPVAELDVLDEGEGGLLGMALHPEFPDTRLAYLYYTSADGNRVSRFPVDEQLRFGDEEELLTIPEGPVHDGGRIAFGPDDLLYVGTGETGDPDLAAERDSPAGKVLRITPDGEPADGNPFGNSPVFSSGHRNVQGLDWDRGGNLFASEHGPSGELGLCCHDEVNLVTEGGFYGWPFFAGEARAQPGDPPADPIDPLVESGSDTTWAPSGLAVHEPDRGRGEVLVANLAGQELLSFPLRGDGSEPALGEPEAVVDEFGRLRAATVGPDGCLYVTTSNTDGRGDPGPDDDRLLRVCPED